jgi:arylsulfatase A-like enzyme
MQSIHELVSRIPVAQAILRPIGSVCTRYFLVGLAAILTASPNALSSNAAKPNFVVILADDLGYGDVSCYNEQAKVATPNVDRLACEGIKFLDAHSPSTVCTPTRYSLMTGRMAFRAPNGGAVFTGVGGPSLIEPNRLTVSKMLKTAGYSTHCVGKWHIGLTFFDKNGKPVRDNGVDAVRQVVFSRRIEGGPIDHGFEQFFGTACCPTTDWLYAFIENDRIPLPPTELLDNTKLPKHPYANDCRRGLIAPDFPMEEIDLVFLKKSREFIEQHIRESPEKPFFLYHATQAVHLPSFAAPQFLEKSKAGPHGDFILEFDFIVGELLSTLEKLGIADNTVVILTSDNGPETTSVVHMRADHNHDGARPWRGMKRDAWEGGHRVPFLVRWPGKIKPGSVSSQTMSLTDLMATIASVVDYRLPSNAAEDSFNMLPAWLGEDKAPIRPYLLQQAAGGARTLSIRRGPWKYIDHAGSGGNRYENSSELKPYDLPNTIKAPGQLYNLDSDPGETKNLFLEYPDKVNELKTLLDRSKANGRSVEIKEAAK